MVEGLTASAAHPGADADLSGRDATRRHAMIPNGIEVQRRLECADGPDGASLRTGRVHSVRILVTQAERPHPFPSRTRKLSSPAPKILRGQLLGNIGRRQDPFDSFNKRAPILCVGSGALPYHAAHGTGHPVAGSRASDRARTSRAGPRSSRDDERDIRERGTP